jgi:hypothetical protein
MAGPLSAGRFSDLEHNRLGCGLFQVQYWVNHCFDIQGLGLGLGCFDI